MYTEKKCDRMHVAGSLFTTCPYHFVLPHLIVPVPAHLLYGWSPLSVILLRPASEEKRSLNFTYIPKGSSSALAGEQ